MENLNKLKEQMSALMDKATAKEDIEVLAQMKQTVDAVESDYNKQSQEYKDLLKDYGDVVKASAFKVDTTKVNEGMGSSQTFEDFLKDYSQNHKKEN